MGFANTWERSPHGFVFKFPVCPPVTATMKRFCADTPLTSTMGACSESIGRSRAGNNAELASGEEEQSILKPWENQLKPSRHVLQAQTYETSRTHF